MSLEIVNFLRNGVLYVSHYVCGLLYLYYLTCLLLFQFIPDFPKYISATAEKNLKSYAQVMFFTCKSDFLYLYTWWKMLHFYNTNTILSHMVEVDWLALVPSIVCSCIVR